jgi:hypothetical protein
MIIFLSRSYESIFKNGAIKNGSFRHPTPETPVSSRFSLIFQKIGTMPTFSEAEKEKNFAHFVLTNCCVAAVLSFVMANCCQNGRRMHRALSS